MSLPQRVRVVGTGLLGTSLALALRSHGVDVTLVDTSPTAAALASDMGAGALARPDDQAPDVVVVAAPPDVVAHVVEAELAAWPEATVTDVTSVKAGVADEVARRCGASAARFVPGHPMAGRERSGAVAARSDLFEGRTWVVCPDVAEPARVAQVRAMAERCGAVVVAMDAREHDRAVAAVSHVPQVAASLVAAQLLDLPDEAVALSGQGVRDVTRIAASDPMLWTQILSGNSAAVLPIVERLRDGFDDIATALRMITSAGKSDAVGDGVRRSETAASTTPTGGPTGSVARGPRAVIARAIADGQDGRARIPGKHGAPAQPYTTVAVVIPDEPGALGRVFTLVGSSGVSVEDVRIEHDEGVAAGLLELSVLPAKAHTLHEALVEAGWAAHVLETN